MLILGIDPGSINTGYALIEINRGSIKYVKSGVLKYNAKEVFLDRLQSVAESTSKLISECVPDEVALESLIYVKSPTSLIKLAQVRGIILSHVVSSHRGKIFEYSPNLVKSAATGHGHADKESIQKFVNLITGHREYETHDESDALAVAICHALNRDKKKTLNNNKWNRGSRSSSLAGSLSHKIKD